MIELDGPVFIGFLTLSGIWTLCAIFALVDFFLPSVLVSFYIPTVLKMKGFSCRAAESSFFVYLEVYGPERIISILSI